MSFLKTLKMLFLKKFSKKSLSICERETVLPLYYPKKGIGELPKKIYEKVIQNKGEIILNCEITKIKKENKKWIIEYKNNNELKNIQCDYLVSTIPIFDLIEYFQNIKSEEIIEALNKLGYLSLIVVNIIIKNNRTFDWSYLYTINRIYKRISNIKDFSPFACSSNENILALEITCNFNDNIWNMSDNEIFEKCKADLIIDRFINENEIIDFNIIRIKNVYPIFRKEYKDNLKKVLSYINNIGNNQIFLSGRIGSYKYKDMDECIEEAEILVNKIKE